MSIFFVSCQPGLEQDLKSEIEMFWHQMIDLDGLPTRSRPEFIDCEIIGGLEINCEKHLGYQINLFSKLANRVLLRVSKFTARYFDQFEKELKRINFKEYFAEHAFSIQVDASKSRLFHERNLIETAYKSFGLSVKNISDEKKQDMLQVYIRIYKDEATISIDTSGQHLHKRGYRIEQGVAPIRETLAAKVYFKILQLSYEAKFDLFEKDAQFTFFDPFCGSGTMLFEAVAFKLPILDHSYAFERFANRPALMKSETWKKNFKITDLSRFSVLGIEKDPETFKKLSVNKEHFCRKFPQMFGQRISFFNADSKSFDFQSLHGKKSILITNPPYGERLDSDEAVKIIKKIITEVQPQGIVIIHPTHWNLLVADYQKIAVYDFDNQGLKLNLTILKQKSI